MADRQKAIEAFIRCGTPGACSDKCAYFSEGFNCYRAMKHDLLELLKEQPEQKHGHWIEYPKCLEYDGALDDTYIVCSACEHVFNVIDNCTELFDYCPKCGAKMDEEVEQDG